MNENDFHAQRSVLAIQGGKPVRSKPMPPRRLFEEDSLKAVTEVFHSAWESGKDFGFQGPFEERYTRKFSDFQGGGYTDAVSSGSVACAVAFRALGPQVGDEVVVSPVTNPGGINGPVMGGHPIRVADSEPDTFNMGPDQFEKALSEKTRFAVLTHSGGHPLEMGPIMEIARAKGIRVIEDCSQAHGALYRNQRVGTFGDVAAFSTGFSKNHATGGCGGLIFTKSKELYWEIRSHADRGKPFEREGFDGKNATWFKFPALNHHLDELSCAIGEVTLSRLEGIIQRRAEITKEIDRRLSETQSIYPISRNPESIPSIFFHTVRVRPERLTCSKEEFALAIAAEGMDLNAHYQELVSTWPWIEKSLVKPVETPNVLHFRNTSFNILFNERYGTQEIEDIIQIFKKVESVYLR